MLNEALRIRQQEQLPALLAADDSLGYAITQGRIADALQEKGQLDEALRIYREEQLPIFEKFGDVRARAITQDRIAHVLQLRGQSEEALRIRRDEQFADAAVIDGLTFAAVAGVACGIQVDHAINLEVELLGQLLEVCNRASSTMG